MTDSLATILVVEDGQSEREALVRVLRLEHYKVLAARHPDEALAFTGQPVDLVISDLRMGKRSGLDLLKDWRSQFGDTPFIMMTAFGDVDSAVAAMKLGAADFLSKPIEPEDLLSRVRDCLQARGRRAGDGAPSGEDYLSRIIGESPGIREVCEQVRRVAATDTTVVILGEPGAGKELVAEAIHYNSRRAAGPYVPVDMAAIPEAMIESELFGHVQGAFEGAIADRVGRFEAADEGTIFIDEISDFPLALQAKLLRVLENQVVMPLGANQGRSVNVRVVAATCHDLSDRTSEGQFRQDLFYRLNVVAIRVPPLRERPQDIPLLVAHFVRNIARAHGSLPCEVTPELMRKLTGLPWPGNVRQLRNCLESMIVLAPGASLRLADLPPELLMESPIERRPDDDTRDSVLEETKRDALMRALRLYGGNRTRAAEYLGISVRTVQRKLKEWGLADSMKDVP